MLEEKKAQGSEQQSSAHPVHPKTPKINDCGRNLAVGKTTNHILYNSNAINPACRFALLLDHCAPSAPSPLTSPLLGGLPGSSLLIGQQAASLRLAQLKTQLALTQINTFALGSRAVTLTANSSTPAPYISTTLPSPTAAAINLLNLLKIANIMSHPLYNPYASGNQSSTQGQYGLSSRQAERDPRRASPRLGPGSSFSTSVNPVKSGGTIPPLMTQSVSYRSEQSRTLLDKDIERSIDMHISRAREEGRFLGKPTHQPVGQGTRFSNTQRDEFLSSGTSYPMSSTSTSLGHSDAESGSSSMDWLSNYKRPTADDSPKFYPSSASSSYASSSSSGGRFKATSERELDMQSIPGLGDYDYPTPDKPVAPPESSRPKYTSESAANILLHFGLEKEDLEHLISYPEDQITPANLPFILRQIRIQKAKRAATAVESKSYPEPQPTRSMSGIDSLNSSVGGVIRQEEMPSAVLPPSKVIDYGHTGKYTGGVRDEIGRTASRTNSGGSGSMLLMDTYDSSTHNREQLQKNINQVKSSALDSSRDKGSSVTSLSSSHSSILSSVAPSSNDPTKRLQTQPIQTSQTIPSSFSLPKQDTDIRVRKPEASKPLLPKESEADLQSKSKTQPSCALFRGMHPSRPGLVIIDSKVSGSKGQSKTKGQTSTVAEPMKQQETQQKQIRQQQQMQKQKPPSQMGRSFWPPVFPAAKPVHPASLLPGITEASRAMSRSMFIPGDPRPLIIPPAPPQPIPGPMNFIGMPLPPSIRGPPAKISKGLPTPAMMHDYAAATPRIFPHTCSLCNKECTHMKDWISHQNTSLHLESCKVLRAQYPEWDGEVVLGPSAAGKDAKSSFSTSAQASQHRHQKSRHGSHSRSRSRSRSRSSSRSHSPSPRRHRGLQSRREKRSRSRSPHSSRYTRGSRSRSRSRSRSPRYDRTTSFRNRSRSRSHERRSSPRRRDERRSSPRRSEERQSSPRSRDRRLSPRRSGEKRSSPRRSRERRSSTERSSPQRKKSSSAESLAKLLNKSGVQSLSNQSELEAMVKTLAPALLAEIAKIESSSSSPSSSSSSKAGKHSRSSPSGGGKSTSSVVSSSSTPSAAKKKELTAVSSKAKPNLQKSEVGKSSPPTMVKLEGIRNSLSHSEVVAAAEHYGKTKSVVLFRSKLEAIVCFEKEEDAKKLKSIKTFNVKGMPVTVVKEKDTVSKDQKNPPQKKPGTGKPTNEKTALKISGKGSTSVTKAKVLVSKAKNVSTKQTAKDDKSPNRAVAETTKDSETGTEAKALASGVEMTSKTPIDNGAVAEAVKKDKVEEGTAKDVNVAGSTASENQTDVEASKLKESETKVRESGVFLEDAAKVTETGDTLVSQSKHQAEAAKGEVEMKKAIDAEPMELGETRGEEAESMEVETCAEGKEEITNTETVPHEPNESDPITSMADARPYVSPAKSPTVPMQSTEATTNTQSPQTAMEIPENSAKALLQVQQISLAELESTAEGPETMTEISQIQQQVAGISAEAALEAKLTGVETKTTQKEPVIAGKTQVHTASTSNTASNVSALSTEVVASDTTEPAAAAVSEQQPSAGTLSAALNKQPQAAATSPSSAAVSEQQPPAAESSSAAAVRELSPQPALCSVIPPTIGEMVENVLRPDKIMCLNSKTCLLPKYLVLGQKLLFVTNLPRYYDGCYTEGDIATLFIPFGYIPNEDSMYIIPQARMAFVLMKSAVDVQNMLKTCKRSRITFKESKLQLRVVASGITMTPLGFYKSLMKRMKSVVLDDGERTIFIKDISPSEAQDLREALNKIGFIRNYLPLLNKVFIEFESVRDADRLGVWYSLLKQPPGHKVYRLKTPHSKSTSLPPRLAANAMPESKDVVAGAAVPTTTFGVPPGSISPFWVMMTTTPFVFPTMSPWFIIPDYLTVKEKEDIVKAKRQGSVVPTIMLTGLPEGNYKHEDIAKLVWPYFPRQNIHSLYYNVIVLTLQRRAFVYFSDWTACCDFVQDHIINPVSVKGVTLNIHFILQDMYAESNEEIMYKTLMRWSNARVPDDESLEERLLCVEISETNVDVVKKVIEVVASIATFVSFLPLANRVCVEMADSSGVAEVVKKYNTYSPDSFSQRAIWSKVQRFETLKSLKQRLENSKDITIHFELDDTSDTTEECLTQPHTSDLSDNGGQHDQQTSSPASAQTAASAGSTISESVMAGPSVTTASDIVVKECGAKPGTQSTMDFTIASKANEDVKGEEGLPTTSFGTADKNSVLAASSLPVSATGLVKPEENVAELPRIDEDIFKALTAAVRQHRLTRGSKMQSEENESLSKSNTNLSSVNDEDTVREKGQDDYTDDSITSDAYLFDEQNFNMEDFFVVDEVGDDVLDTSWSFSPLSSKGHKQRQSSDVPSKDSESSASSIPSSSSSSNVTKASMKNTSSSSLTSVSPKTSKNSSEPNLSLIKPSASASVTKTASSSSMCTETPAFSGQKTQQSKTKSVAKASNTASSGCRPCLPPTASEMEKTTTVVVVETSVVTHPEEEAKTTENSVSKSENSVSTEDTAAKAVDVSVVAESSEMQPSTQRHEIGLTDQTQNLEIGFIDDTLKDLKEREEDDDIENYEILDVLDDLSDEPVGEDDQAGNVETQLAELEESHILHEENFQVLDSLDDEGCIEMEMETKNQVAPGQEDSHLLKGDSSVVRQLSEEDVNQVVDKLADKGVIYENQEAFNKDTFQVLDTGSKQAPRNKGDEKMKKQEEVQGKTLETESCSVSIHIGKPDDQSSDNKEQCLQEHEKSDTLKTVGSDVNEQETFEILDSIDDQTAEKDINLKLPTSSDQILKDDSRPMTTDMDSGADKEERRKKGQATAWKDDKPSKTSGPRTRSCKSEGQKLPKIQAVKKYDTRTKTDTSTRVSQREKKTTEAVVYEIVDSVEDEPVQDGDATERSGKRSSARLKRENKMTVSLTEASNKSPATEDTCQILNFVDNKTASGEPTVMTRFTRGKRDQRTNDKTKKQDTPTRRRTPSSDSCEKTPKKEVKPLPRESIPIKKNDDVVSEVSEEDTTYEILDSVEDEVKDDRPISGGKGRRGRPAKGIKTTKQDRVLLEMEDNDASEKAADEEEETYQILDSVEDEMVDEQPPTEQSKIGSNEKISEIDQKSVFFTESSKTEEEEEEPVYQIVDCLEDDHIQEELMTIEVSNEGGRNRSKKTDETAEKGVTLPSVTEAPEQVGVQDRSLHQINDDFVPAGPPPAAEESVMGQKERTPKTLLEENKKQRSLKKNQTAVTSALVNLDEVSEEEEDYPDDTAEEEELRKRQATTKEKQLTNERHKEREERKTEERRSRGREEREREQRSWSRSSSREGGGGTRRGRKRGREKEEKIEVDAEELVTLDEVGADEAGEERLLEGHEWDGEITEGELQTLITLDEIVEEEVGKAEQNTFDTHPPCKEHESVDFLNPETLVTLDEAGDDEEEKADKDQAEKTTRSAKRKHDDTEESMNFVTVDQVGEVEEEVEKEVVTVTTRTRGRAKKKTRQTPVRKSTRWRKVDKEEEKSADTDVPPPASPSPSSSLMLSHDSQPEVQKTEAEVEVEFDTSAGPQREHPESQSLEGNVEGGWNQANLKVARKGKSELDGPEAKRSRSQSPCVPANFKLPPFSPNKPLGQDFVVPKWGFFCNLCSVFYLNESTAKDLHCSSQRHYDNLKKHYQKLQQKPSKLSARNSQGSLSD
ncbi:uncharacterized protein znf638 isoform X2 [Mastacembelus armatus]|uniref:uncharacterized protein znf638 isoform X2 n=1 Tax=Mastacembelus armatus TaxID=205130 RepID=UPI000E45560C|nr:uncharacterized protein LOC113143645 isoform X2 [Mastacembelus armatus]